MSRRRRKSKKESGLYDLMLLVTILSAFIISLIIKVLMFVYDLITVYSTAYKEKSGNGFLKTYFDKGNYGEFKLYRKLVRRYGKNNLYPNLYLPGKNTTNTEIDLVLLSKKGIFVFEVKNYGGYIYGSKHDEMWTQVLSFRTKHKFYNPLRQNYAHTKALEQYLELDHERLVSVISFTNRSKLKKINTELTDNIYQTKDTLKYVRNAIRNNPEIFNEQELIEVREKLIQASNVSEEIKEKHILEVQKLVEENIKIDIINQP